MSLQSEITRPTGVLKPLRAAPAPWDEDRAEHGFFGRALDGSRPEDRRRAALAIGAARAVLAKQIHGADVINAEDVGPDDPAPDADAVVSGEPGLAAGVLTADCAPILLADGEAGLVAAVHAGWRGAVKGVIAAAVAALEARGARVERLAAVLGPMIAAPSYEVRTDFVAQATAADPKAAEHVIETAGGLRFDLPAYVAARVRACGVMRITALPVDVFAECADWRSRRASLRDGHAAHGSNIALIAPRRA